MRRVRGNSTISPLKATPGPPTTGWSFVDDNKQLKVVIGKADVPKYKLIYDKRDCGMLNVIC